MRAKEQRLVVTFRTTAGAMAMEKLCHEHKLPGRLIPGTLRRAFRVTD